MQNATFRAMKQPMRYDHTEPVPAVAITAVATTSSDAVGVMSDRISATCPSEFTTRFSSWLYPSDSRDCCELGSAPACGCASDTATPAPITTLYIK